MPAANCVGAGLGEAGRADGEVLVQRILAALALVIGDHLADVGVIRAELAQDCADMGHGRAGLGAKLARSNRVTLFIE